jgi:hypothetical protein
MFRISGCFNDSETATMAHAYDIACGKLAGSGLLPLVKEVIANRILLLESDRRGLDAEKLATDALKSLGIQT